MSALIKLAGLVMSLICLYCIAAVLLGAERFASGGAAFVTYFGFVAGILALRYG